MPAPAAAKAASPALDAVVPREIVFGSLGACCSIAVSLASRTVPAKANGTVHFHWDLSKWKGAVNKSFWSMNRLRGKDFSVGEATSITGARVVEEGGF